MQVTMTPQATWMMRAPRRTRKIWNFSSNTSRTSLCLQVEFDEVRTAYLSLQIRLKHLPVTGYSEEEAELTANRTVEIEQMLAEFQSGGPPRSWLNLH